MPSVEAVLCSFKANKVVLAPGYDPTLPLKLLVVFVDAGGTTESIMGAGQLREGSYKNSDNLHRDRLPILSRIPDYR
jgi:hypothetical protein